MNRQRLTNMQAATGRFIEKRLRVNKPFQSLIASPQFDTLNNKLNDALRAQFKAVADKLAQSHNVAIATDDLLLKFVEVNLPPLADYIDQQDVFDYLRFCYVEGVRAQYGRFGLKTSAQQKMAKGFDTSDDEDQPDFSFNMNGSAFDFVLSNPGVIDALNNDASFLLNKSNIDDTTRQQLIKLIQQAKLGDNNATIDEIASQISDAFPDIADYRALAIARTETANAMGQGNYNAMIQNGVSEKKWVLAGSHPCEICQPNADAGYIPVDDTFPSGDDYEPAHPNCECYTEAGEIDLDSIDLWDGS